MNQVKSNIVYVEACYTCICYDKEEHYCKCLKEKKNLNEWCEKYLLQERFEFKAVDDKIYLLDNSGELLGIPTSLNPYEITLEDKDELVKWLDYLNKE